MVEVVALPRALADTGEHRITTVRFRDVVDQFHDQNGLADAGTAEQTDLTAFGIWAEQINDLDAGDKNFGFGRLVGQRSGAGRVNRTRRSAGTDRTGFVHWLSNNVHYSTQSFIAHRHCNSLAGICYDSLTADEPLARIHRDCPNGILAKVLRHFEHQTVRPGCPSIWSCRSMVSSALRIGGSSPSN